MLSLMAGGGCSRLRRGRYRRLMALCSRGLPAATMVALALLHGCGSHREAATRGSEGQARESVVTHVEVPFIQPARERVFSPAGVAAGGDGQVYLLDGETGLVKEFSKGGEWVREFKVAEPGSLPGGQALALDERGDLLVLDAEGSVDRFDGTGGALGRAPASAKGAGEGARESATHSEQPMGGFGDFVAACRDGRGNSYELWYEMGAGYGTDLVKLDPHGKEMWRRNWRAVEGTGLAVGRTGHFFVTLRDFKFTAAPCVEVSPDGEEIRVIGSNGTGPGEVRDPSGLAIDAVGNVYVGDYYTWRLQRFSADGRFLNQVMGPKIRAVPDQDIKPAEDGYGPPTSVAVGPDGRIYVTRTGAGLDQVLSVFSPRGERLRSFSDIRLRYGGYTNMHFGASPRYPASVALDSQGHVWTAIGLEAELVEREGRRGADELRGGGVQVAKYDQKGKKLLSFGRFGSGPGAFERLGVFSSTRGAGLEGVSASLLAVGKDDGVWVVDWGNDRVQRFDREGRYLGQIGPEVGAGRLEGPWGVATDGRGHVYVADQRSISEFEPEGTFVATVAVLGDSQGARHSEYMARYRAIAVDQSRNVYVTDAARESVRKFVPDVRQDPRSDRHRRQASAE